MTISWIMRVASLEVRVEQIVVRNLFVNSCRESIRILHAVFEVILPSRRFEHAFVATTILPTLRSRSPCASWALFFDKVVDVPCCAQVQFIDGCDAPMVMRGQRSALHLTD